MNRELQLVKEHVAGCATCTRANKRVNDFCDRGRFLFAEFTKTPGGQPTSAKMLSAEESRKVIEQERARTEKRRQN